MRGASTVDEYISLGGEWEEALVLLRELMNSTGLEETVKWGMPVYTLNNKNVVGFSAFKSWTGIWFYQGVFLKDPEDKLINAQEGTTRGLRQWRFGTVQEIRDQRTTILSYLKEAIENQKAGKEIKPHRNKPLHIPAELEEALANDPALRDRFDTLSVSRRREYAEHLGSAKRAETREKRLARILPMILEGIGLNDKYKSRT